MDKHFLPDQTAKKCIASFTGHRIVAGTETGQLRYRTDEIIEKLIEYGVLSFMAGGAIGFDALASIAVLKAREHNPKVNLIMVLPCCNQEVRWNETDRGVYRSLLDNADKVIYVSKQPYFDGCMKLRNEYLIKNSNICVAYLKHHRRSGTSQTVRLARERGLKVINLADDNYLDISKTLS